LTDSTETLSHKSNHISIVTSDNFETEVLERSLSTLVLVDFWAGWCNPCKLLMPILEKLTTEYDGKFHLAKIDSEKEKCLTEKFSVRSLPTVKIFKLRDIVDEFMGVLPEPSIREFIDRHQVSDLDLKFQSALEALELNDKFQARQLLEAILKTNDAHANSLMLLAKIELDDGNNQLVEDIISHMPLQNINDELVREIKALNDFSKEISDIEDINILINDAATSDDIHAQYQLACYFALNKKYEKALEIFISIMQKDRKYKDDGAKKSILEIFDLLGGSGPLVNIYRVKMSRLLH